jgi:hypothetical protein
MRYEAARHRHIHHKEARAINVDFDVATALSGGLVSCIALAQVPNGHSVAIESLDVLMYATLSLYEHHCPARSTSIASSRGAENALGQLARTPLQYRIDHRLVVGK